MHSKAEMDTDACTTQSHGMMHSWVTGVLLSLAKISIESGEIAIRAGWWVAA